MKTGTGVVQKHGKQLFYCVLFHVLLHILLLRENRSQWFRHSEYTVKSGDGNEASSSIRVANRTLQNNMCLVYFRICCCPSPVFYAMF